MPKIFAEMLQQMHVVLLLDMVLPDYSHFLDDSSPPAYLFTTRETKPAEYPPPHHHHPPRPTHFDPSLVACAY
jgi:hypothetical protein